MAVLDRAGKWIERPLVALHTDDVGVCGDEHRLPAAVAAKPREEMRLSRFRRRHDLDVETEGSEVALEQLRDFPFVSRRIAGVRANELGQQLRRGIRAAVPSGLRRGRKRRAAAGDAVDARSGRENQNDDNRDAPH